MKCPHRHGPLALIGTKPSYVDGYRLEVWKCPSCRHHRHRLVPARPPRRPPSTYLLTENYESTSGLEWFKCLSCKQPFAGVMVARYCQHCGICFTGEQPRSFPPSERWSSLCSQYGRTYRPPRLLTHHYSILAHGVEVIGSHGFPFIFHLAGPSPLRRPNRPAIASVLRSLRSTYGRENVTLTLKEIPV